jgi:ABC-type phosphate/phosphonate transport system substrate-binding protein
VPILRLLPFLLLLPLLLAPVHVGAQEVATSPTLVVRVGDPLLRIGFLRPEGEVDLTPRQMEELRRHLLGDEAVAAEMKAAGYDDVGLFPADGGGDLLRRLDAVEFDLAFVPSRLWAEQQAGYTVVLQTRRSRDFTATRGNRVLQRGVVFASPRSPLFTEADPASPAARRRLAEARIAVVSSQSMAGFVAPMLGLQAEFGVTHPSGGLLWFESSAEVAKAVLAGLADVGACEAGALEEVMREAGLDDEADSYRRVLLRTAPVPTDPVVVRPSLAPARSPLGRELRRSLRQFSLGGGLGGVSLQPAEDADYTVARELLREFDARVGEVRR